MEELKQQVEEKVLDLFLKGVIPNDAKGALLGCLVGAQFIPEKEQVSLLQLMLNALNDQNKLPGLIEYSKKQSAIFKDAINSNHH